MIASVVHMVVDLVSESTTHIRVRLDPLAEPIRLSLDAIDASIHDPIYGQVSLVIPEDLAREMGIAE
jgi:hypothetical protein